MSGMKSTALQLAIESKQRLIIRMLLQYRADPNSFSPYGDSGAPIQQLVEQGDIELVQVSLNYGAKPDTITEGVPHTALQIACRDGHKEIVDMLLESEQRADVNAPPATEYGATALQFAAISGFLGIANLLLDHGADVNAAAAEVDGRTALEGAAEHGRIDMVQFLITAGADITDHSPQGQSFRAMDFASNNGHHETRRLLESYRDMDGDTELGEEDQTFYEFNF